MVEPNRKLAAILSADVVGYARLIQTDDAGTVDLLKRYRAAVGRIVARHNGRVVNTPGDSILAELATATEAVHAAIDIQRDIEGRNIEFETDRQMHLRIGVNLGEVIEEDDGTLYGDGVNIAARMEALAEGGGIVVSATIHEHVKGKLDAGFDDLGPQEVKNIAEPVRAYRVRTDGASATARRKSRTRARRRTYATAAVVVLVGAALAFAWSVTRQAADSDVAAVENMAHPLPTKPSIVVLPLDNLSGDPELEVLADGLSENITAALSQVRDLFVIARNSAFTYKGEAVKVREVAEELGVRYVLEGSLQRSGDNIRVTAQLIDALSGDHLWSGRYERALTNIFEVQDDITLNLVTALQVELVEGSQAALWLKASSYNLEAWRNFWRGQELFWPMTAEDNPRSRQLLQKAVELDPDFALAWMFLGLTHIIDFTRGYSPSAEESLDRAEEIANKVLGLENSGPRGYELLGVVYQKRRQYDDAIATHEKALAISPSEANLHNALAETLYLAGRPDEALVHVRQAMRLNPHYPVVYLDVLADAARLAGRYEESAAAAERSLERAPESEVEPLIYLIYDYVKLGRDEDARAAVEELLRRAPDFSVEVWKPKFWQRQPYRDQAVIDDLFDTLHQAGVPLRPSPAER